MRHSLSRRARVIGTLAGALLAVCTITMAAPGDADDTNTADAASASVSVRAGANAMRSGIRW